MASAEHAPGVKRGARKCGEAFGHDATAVGSLEALFTIAGGGFFTE